jgi:hypothetical protein
VLEGESLVNDATALIAHGFALLQRLADQLYAMAAEQGNPVARAGWAKVDKRHYRNRDGKLRTTRTWNRVRSPRRER